MSRNDEARAFHYAVYEEVIKIPYGKVTTYGHIAKLIYKPRNSRQVGQALKFLPKSGTEGQQPHDYPYDSETVPWWRVISSAGEISPREKDKMIAQRERLLREGVQVTEQNKVRLGESGWFPETELDD